MAELLGEGEVTATDDYAVESVGAARVFGYAPLNLSSEHEIYDAVWRAHEEAFDDARAGKAELDLQVCAVAGLKCAWCGGRAVGYIRLGCFCNGPECREWVCGDCASW